MPISDARWRAPKAYSPGSGARTASASGGAALALAPSASLERTPNVASSTKQDPAMIVSLLVTACLLSRHPDRERQVDRARVVRQDPRSAFVVIVVVGAGD